MYTARRKKALIFINSHPFENLHLDKLDLKPISIIQQVIMFPLMIRGVPFHLESDWEFFWLKTNQN